MSRVRESLQALIDKAKICDVCNHGRTWEPACRACGKHMCEPCFQYSQDKCCGISTYDIPDTRNNGKKRIPDLPYAIR